MSFRPKTKQPLQQHLTIGEFQGLVAAQSDIQMIRALEAKGYRVRKY